MEVWIWIVIAVVLGALAVVIGFTALALSSLWSLDFEPWEDDEDF